MPAHHEQAMPFGPAAPGLTPQAVLGQVLADLPGPERVRLAPPLVRRLSDWTGRLRAVRRDSARGVILAIWLPYEVEAEVDLAMSRQPSLGLLLHRLAARLVMAALAGLEPELADRGCAPLAQPGPETASDLAAHGLTDQSGRLVRRYAVLTAIPLDSGASGCSTCGLRAGCPGPRHGGAS